MSDINDMSGRAFTILVSEDMHDNLIRAMSTMYITDLTIASITNTVAMATSVIKVSKYVLDKIKLSD